MTLYQAIYQADRTGHCRRMTYAAEDQSRAEQIARDWQINAARPLIVRPLHPINLTLELRP